MEAQGLNGLGRELGVCISRNLANNQGEVGLVSRLFLLIMFCFQNLVMCAANREEASDEISRAVAVTRFRL